MWFIPKESRKSLKCLTIVLFKKIMVEPYFFNIFLERGEGREKEKETDMDVRNIDQLPLECSWTRDQTCNPGTYRDQESHL